MNESYSNPWEAPKSKPTDLWNSGEARRPGVLTWHTIYCVFMALMYLVVGAFGLLALIGFWFMQATDEPMSDEDRIGGLFGGVFMIALGGSLGCLFGAAPFLPTRPWTWIYGLVLIALGMTSCLSWPATIPLLIYWLRPEAKAYFSRPAN